MKFYFASERYTFWQFLYKFTRSGGPNAVLLIYFFVLLSSLYSCNPVYYAPGPQQLPAFSNSLETKVNLGYVVTPSAVGLEASVLHTPTQNLTLAAGHAAFTGQSVSGQTSIYGNGSLSELGIGYYLWLNDQRSLVFDHCFYWGYGNFLYRSSHPLDSNENYHIGSKFQRFSQLTGLSYRSKYFEAGLSVKLAYLQYYEPTLSRFCPSAYVDMVVQHNRLFVAEPCLTLKAGPSFLKFYLSIEASKNLSLAAFPQEKEKLSFGLLARF
ncbi:MAG TPA: hypothetical protein PK037_00295 [Saprospiraceae bacterium]|nr:hypothetical protein [Saprospiraceae bacterium]